MARCRIVQVDGEPVRVQDELRTSEDVAAPEQIVRAAKADFAPTTCQACGHQEDRHHHEDDGEAGVGCGTDCFVYRCTCHAFTPSEEAP